MDLLQGLGKFLGWLSGIVAGLTALLYGLGFIATVAHQNLLGLDWAVMERQPLWFLGLGGQVAARFALLTMASLLLVIIMGEVVRLVGTQLGSGDPARRGRTARWVQAIARHRAWFLALLALVLVGLMTDAFGEALTLSDLLFAEPDTLCRADGVLGEIVGAERGMLDLRANEVAFYAALAIGVTGYAAPLLLNGRAGPLPLIICGAVLLQAAGAVPSAHGIFVMEKRLPALTGAAGTLGEYAEGQIYLAARTSKGLWVWEPATRQIGWFSEADFQHLRIGPRQSIESLACASEANP